MIHGRGEYPPDDVKSLAHAVLAHRLVLSTDAELRELTPADAVESVLATVETPSAPTSAPKIAE